MRNKSLEFAAASQVTRIRAIGAWLRHHLPESAADFPKDDYDLGCSCDAWAEFAGHIIQRPTVAGSYGHYRLAKRDGKKWAIVSHFHWKFI